MPNLTRRQSLLSFLGLGAVPIAAKESSRRPVPVLDSQGAVKDESAWPDVLSDPRRLSFTQWAEPLLGEGPHFTLCYEPIPGKRTFLSINGITQHPDRDYEIKGKQLTLKSFRLKSSDSAYIWYAAHGSGTNSVSETPIYIDARGTDPVAVEQRVRQAMQAMQGYSSRLWILKRRSCFSL